MHKLDTIPRGRVTRAMPWGSDQPCSRDAAASSVRP